MAPPSATARIEELNLDSQERHPSPPTGREKFVETVSHEIFKYDRLDRRLKRHHITGIAFSGAVGIGLFQTSGEVIAEGGPVGALLAFIFAGLVIFSVMRSLAEMVSVRPVKGALMDYPDVFVDEALGFAVGIMYWCDTSDARVGAGLELI